eukprot:m.207028 g.207028  ORF g.207028 m.207028 type:complete len:67 (-) comp13759_c1_seq13:119-319(-)
MFDCFCYFQDESGEDVDSEEIEDNEVINTTAPPWYRKLAGTCMALSPSNRPSFDDVVKMEEWNTEF